LSFEKLKEEFNQKVKELRAKCKHPKTEWMQYCWAIAHSTRFEVEVCLICNAILNKRTICDYCSKTIYETNWIKSPKGYGRYFCSRDCESKYFEENK